MEKCKIKGCRDRIWFTIVKFDNIFKVQFKKNGV